MASVTTKDGTQLYVNDWGDGAPVVLIHGWPLNADMWEYQVPALLAAGHRVIAYDRRGFGRSSQPGSGYDYDTFADDLESVLEALNVRGAALVGFSMGGGEVARYLSRHAGAGVSKVVLLGAVPPFLLKTDDNPYAAPIEVFEGMMAAIGEDRPGFLTEFAKGFFGIGTPGIEVSDALLAWSHGLAMQAAGLSTVACVKAFGTTDFRGDVASFTMPTLIQHGDADQIVPIDGSARRMAQLLPDAKLIEYPGAPHALFYTHRKQVNADLIAFLKS